MAAITSNGTGGGNWNSTGSWAGGVIPGSGDTVTIANGDTITVPVGYTAVCGTSPTSDAGAVALQCASASGTGILIVNGTLKWQGPVRQANATWQVGAGGTLTYDASGAATPATALYSWQISQGNSQANARLLFNGSNGSRCTVNSVGNVQSGGFGNTGTNWADGGRVEATYTDFSYMGAATSSGSFIIPRLSSAVSLTFDSCTIDNCGQIQMSTFSGTSTFRLANTKITNPANTTYTFQTAATPATLTSGTRLIQNCDITGQVFYLGTAGVSTGLTLKNTIIRNSSRTNTAGGGMLTWTNGTSIAAWDQNLIVLSSDNTAADPAVSGVIGSMTNTYLFRQVNPNYSNCHPVYVHTQSAASNWDFNGWVFDYTGADGNSDMIEPNGADASVPVTITVRNSLFLPNAAGEALGSFYNDSANITRTNVKAVFDHNTCLLSTVGSAVMGVGLEGASENWPAGAVTSQRSNIGWRLTSGGGWWNHADPASTIATGAVTVADYNCNYQVTGTIYALPLVAQYATTPGTHDLTANPQFVDTSRNMLSFDQGYLGAAVATAWATSTVYAVGDVRSASTGAFFGGATYNYRCVTAHTSGATTKPGSGNNWTANWEPAGLKSISDAVIAGTTYAGGTNSLIGELVAWVKSGYAPKNAALKNAGHDGVTIGAVEGVFGNHNQLTLTGCG